MEIKKDFTWQAWDFLSKKQPIQTDKKYIFVSMMKPKVQKM